MLRKRTLWSRQTMGRLGILAADLQRAVAEGHLRDVVVAEGAELDADERMLTAGLRLVWDVQSAVGTELQVVDLAEMALSLRARDR